MELQNIYTISATFWEPTDPEKQKRIEIMSFHTKELAKNYLDRIKKRYRQMFGIEYDPGETNEYILEIHEIPISRDFEDYLRLVADGRIKQEVF